ncbi:MAG: class I SAM-dependent methyltransferase [Cyclobacteriaceae bacterium]
MNFYDKIAGYYELIFPHRAAKEHFLLQYLNKSGKVLEVGCATGAMAISLANHGHEVKAIDLNEKMIKLAKEQIVI